MRKMIKMVAGWLDHFCENSRLNAAGFHYCEHAQRWKLDERVFPTRHAAMEHLRDLTVAEAIRRAAR